MFEPEMIEQLKDVFSQLERPVTLKARRSDHPDHPMLVEMLTALSEISEKVRFETSETRASVPQFELFHGGKPVGISFRGVPGGHEFSSLILSILYSDQKGKRPDEALVERVRSLRGPIRLRTYVSLSCENCPEVIQALNLLATLHPDFHHEMVDGAVTGDEVESLGIQGVPAVFTADNRLLHSGRANLLELVRKLEAMFGKREDSLSRHKLGSFDVAIIGAGPAGISAAIYSARKGLRTAVVAETVGGQLQETKGIENMISLPYTEGKHLAAQLSEHVARYPVQLFEHRRVGNIEDVEGQVKRIRLESGETLDARTLIVATGAKWRELGIPGEREYLGRGVAFCAHCDGPFYRNKKVAVIGGGNSGVEAAIDLAGLAREVVLLEVGERLKADKVLVSKFMSLPNVSFIPHAETLRILGDASQVNQLEYRNQNSGELKVIDLDGVFVQIGLSPNSQFLKGVIELNGRGEIVVDAKGRTSLPGVYAAGDVTTIPFKQIITSMGDGAKVALAAFEDRLRAAETK